MIYFIELVDKGHIKIGYTNNIINRMSDLRKKHGRLVFLGHIEGGTSDESWILRRFFRYSVKQKFYANGRCPEIFHPHPDLMNFIQSSEVDKSLCDAVVQELKRRAGPVRRGRLPNYEVLQIRQKRESGLSVEEIARAHNVSETAVGKALSNRHYRGVK